MRRLPLILAAVVLAIDQLSKWLVVRNLSLDDVVTPIPGLLNIVYSRNTGVAFGILDETNMRAKAAILIVFSLLIIAGVVFFLWRSHNAGLRIRWALGLILGGAIGNLIDRVRSGSVVDFIDVHIRQHHWHTFNLADSAIVCGAILLVIDIMFSKSPEIGPHARL